MILHHYTAEPFTLDRSRAYLSSGTAWPYKPRGLWVSVVGEDDWPSWCRAEDFHTDRLRHVSEVTLADDANVLILETAAAVRAFTEGYRDARYCRSGGIDWLRVDADYAGIIITPYQWSCRIDSDTAWYFGWDCASGCIWDLDAIASVAAVETAVTR